MVLRTMRGVSMKKVPDQPCPTRSMARLTRITGSDGQGSTRLAPWVEGDENDQGPGPSVFINGHKAMDYGSLIELSEARASVWRVEYS